MSKLPRVTVVVPTYNRARLLANCLCSLDALFYPRDCFEIVAVDDGSQDNTDQILTEFGRRTSSNFLSIRQNNSGPAAARNNGIRRAQGEMIAFIDDDCVADSSWLTELVRGFESANIAGVGGTIRTGSQGIISAYMFLNNVVASNLKGDWVPPFLITANACFKKDLVISVGGFDEHFSHPGGEDPDLCWRILKAGGLFAMNPAAVVYHHHKATMRQFYRMFYNYGWGHAYLEAKHGLGRRAEQGHESVSRWKTVRQLGYRSKRYLTDHGSGFTRAILYAVLDQVRESAFVRGYQEFQKHLTSPAEGKRT